MEFLCQNFAAIHTSYFFFLNLMTSNITNGLHTCISKTEIIWSTVKKLIIFFLCSGQPFSDYYGGKTVKGATGSSMNFTWTIRRTFTRVEWGLAFSPSAFDSPPRLLASFFKGSTSSVTPPAAYTGRVSGNIIGGQVSFALRNLRKSDGRLYGCRISDTNSGDDIPSFDSVMLVVEGRCDCFVVISFHLIQQM